MKILYIANARIPTPRAYGLAIMKICEAFVHAGAEVELIIPTRKYKTPGDPFIFYKTEKSFLFTTLSVPDLLYLGSFGFFISAVWFAERVRWLKSFREADVICSRDALVLIQYLLLGKKIIFEAHSPPSFVSKIVARRAYRFFCISKGLRDSYIAKGVPRGNIIVVPVAVDEHFFDNVPTRDETRVQLGIPTSANIVLYAGHLYPRKGANTLAEAALLMPDKIFFFVGGAPNDVVTFKDRYGNRENIKIVGHVPHDKIPFYLRAADMLVIPNSGKDDDAAHFTSPMKLFEYMLSGTTIIASDVPSIREVLDDTMALFVSPDDPKEMARIIQKSFEHPEEARDRARAALDKVREYTWKKRAETILAHI